MTPARSPASPTCTRRFSASRDKPAFSRPKTAPATAAGTTTDLSRPRFARMYLRTSKNAEARGATEHRRRLLDGLHGTVLELGAGHGLNFPHYPDGVSEVIAIEPEPTLRARAAQAAASAPVAVRVLTGVADELPVADESVDAAVASLVLLLGPRPAPRARRAPSRPAPRRRAALLRTRHPPLPTKAPAAPGRRPQRPVAKIAGGCHPARDTATAIEQAGFQIQSSERIMFAASALEPRSPTSSARPDEPERSHVRTDRANVRGSFRISLPPSPV